MILNFKRIFKCCWFTAKRELTSDSRPIRFVCLRLRKNLLMQNFLQYALSPDYLIKVFLLGRQMSTKLAQSTA